MVRADQTEAVQNIVAAGWLYKHSYIGLNLEWFAFGEGLGAELAPSGHQPDVLNYAWRDDGNRVGVFRMAELFAELKLPVSLLVNAQMYEHAPQAVAAFPNAEIVGICDPDGARMADVIKTFAISSDRVFHDIERCVWFYPVRRSRSRAKPRRLLP